MPMKHTYARINGRPALRQTAVWKRGPSLQLDVLRLMIERVLQHACMQAVTRPDS